MAVLDVAELTARLEAVAGQVASIVEITPERVLQLSSADVATLRDNADDPRAEAIAVLDLVPSFARAFSGGNGRRITALQQEAHSHQQTAEEQRGRLTQTLREKHAAEETIAALDFAIVAHPTASQSLSRRRDEQVALVGTAEQQAGQARQGILTALRAAQQSTSAAHTLEVADGQISVATISRAVVEILRIRRLPAVRIVRLVSDAETNGVIEVRLHPLVMHSPNDNANHLLSDLCFIIPLGATQPAEIKWRGTGHPHAWEHGRVCWGQADRPVAEALGRGDFASCVMFIVGWSRTYKPSYRRLEQYPTTPFDPGFHPELPVTGD